MGRGVFSYSIFFLLGLYTNNYFSFNFFPLLIICIILFSILLFIKNKTTIFLILTHITIFLLGSSSINLSQHINYPLPDRNISTSQPLRDSLSKKLLKLVPNHAEHSTLCALTLGDKTNMPYKLKKSYINAGAMHVLALSGLHIGIVYTIISFCLSFLAINYKGEWVKFIISIIMIFFYSYITGFSPSVIRASIMILIYKLIVLFKRDKDKWNVIALTALIISALSPLNAVSIGFQLSFAAVIGIITLYPICELAFEFFLKKAKKTFFLKIIKSFWSLIAISICCQITTLPISLYYFGSSAQFFLIANIAAIPLATAILYVVIPTIILSGVPIIGEWLVWILNFLLKSLNSIIDFIG